MKDKNGGVVVLQLKKFFGFQSKMYSFLADNKIDHKKVKGVNSKS